MRNEVNVIVEGQEFSFSLQGTTPMANDAARKWLDAQFVALECEPLRPSGKLLLADKLVVLARDAGPKQFADAAWGATFAAAASAALGKPLVQVDADALSVTF
jgi:hypothetical protein